MSLVTDFRKHLSNNFNKFIYVVYLRPFCLPSVQCVPFVYILRSSCFSFEAADGSGEAFERVEKGIVSFTLKNIPHFDTDMKKQIGFFRFLQKKNW